jgi:hypothetical protein
MNFEEFQKVWSTQPSPAPRAATSNPTPEDVALLNRVRADARRFDRTIFWRDTREILAAFFVSAVFARIGWNAHLESSASWPCWLAAALPLGVAIYLLIYRLRHHRPRPAPSAAILDELDHSLARLRHQARLLRTVFWWYLLPLGMSGALLALQIFLYAPTPLPVRIFAAITALSIIALVHIWVARLNHRALKTQLEPRIAELESQREAFRSLMH